MRLFASLLALAVAAPAAAQDLVLEGTLPAGPERFAFVPFEVPAGTREIVFTHGQVLDENIVDFGLNGPDPEALSPSAFRGWSGSNGDVTQITGEAATPGYLPGPLAGSWELVLGAAKVDVAPAPYRVELTFRDAGAVAACAADEACVTLPPDPDRGPYVPPAPLREGPGWYAGDFHVHSVHSGDATPTLDELADAAASIGLDWVEVSEHNTTSHLTVLSAVQARHGDLLLLPGIEWTTYTGHGNAIGLRRFVDHKLGSRGVSLEASVAEIRATGALFAPVHPLIGIGDLCIGCDWDLSVDRSLVDALEVINGDIDGTGRARLEANLALWDSWCDEGRHVVAIGGSDSHRGLERRPTASPLGEPTTLVQAASLSVDALLNGLRAGRTVVKLGGPDEAMVELEVLAPAVRDGDTVTAPEASFVVTVTAGGGEAVPDALSLVVDGAERRREAIASLPFETRITLEAPATGETRLRAEVWSGDLRRSLTSHLWLARPAATPGEDMGDAGGERGGGGCAVGGAPGTVLVALLALARRRKRRNPPRPWHGPVDER
ncbi:MAG: CehA/McbA family metallohydrolase [Myxococcota bacterium]